jgi:hypothetical protein
MRARDASRPTAPRPAATSGSGSWRMLYAMHELSTVILSIASKAMRLCREVVKMLLSPILSLES